MKIRLLMLLLFALQSMNLHAETTNHKTDYQALLPQGYSLSAQLKDGSTLRLALVPPTEDTKIKEALRSQPDQPYLIVEENGVDEKGGRIKVNGSAALDNFVGEITQVVGNPVRRQVQSTEEKSGQPESLLERYGVVITVIGSTGLITLGWYLSAATATTFKVAAATLVLNMVMAYQPKGSSEPLWTRLQKGAGDYFVRAMNILYQKVRGQKISSEKTLHFTHVLGQGLAVVPLQLATSAFYGFTEAEALGAFNSEQGWGERFKELSSKILGNTAKGIFIVGAVDAIITNWKVGKAFSERALRGIFYTRMVVFSFLGAFVLQDYSWANFTLYAIGGLSIPVLLFSAERFVAAKLKVIGEKVSSFIWRKKQSAQLPEFKEATTEVEAGLRCLRSIPVD